MRMFAAFALMLVGCSLLGLAIVAYMQLRSLAVLGAAPDMDNYPALTWVASDLLDSAVNAQQAGNVDPASIARSIVMRTGLLALGAVAMAGAGVYLFLAGSSEPKAAGN